MCDPCDVTSERDHPNCQMSLAVEIGRPSVKCAVLYFTLLGQIYDEPLYYLSKGLGAVCCVREVPEINSVNRKDYKGNTTSFKRRSIYDSVHQLKDGHPASFRDLDEANEHH